MGEHPGCNGVHRELRTLKEKTASATSHPGPDPQPPGSRAPLWVRASEVLRVAARGHEWHWGKARWRTAAHTSVAVRKQREGEAGPGTHSSTESWGLPPTSYLLQLSQGCIPFPHRTLWGPTVELNHDKQQADQSKRGLLPNRAPGPTSCHTLE